VDNFRTRIVDGAVWRYTQINASSAVGRENETIGMGHYPLRLRIDDFVRKATKELDRVRQRGDIERYPEANLIRYSEPPWFDAEGAEPAHIDHCTAFVGRAAHAPFIIHRGVEGTQNGKKNLHGPLSVIRYVLVGMYYVGLDVCQTLSSARYMSTLPAVKVVLARSPGRYVFMRTTHSLQG
jgi:hypothetical protein